MQMKMMPDTTAHVEMARKKDLLIASLEAQLAETKTMSQAPVASVKTMTPEEFMKMNVQVEKINAIKTRVSGDNSGDDNNIVLSDSTDNNLMDAMLEGQ